MLVACEPHVLAAHARPQGLTQLSCLMLLLPACCCRRYRTTLCGQGEACNRNVCFFAHNHNELRIPGGDVAAKGSRSKFGPSADPAAELLAQLSLGAGSSRGSSSQQAQRLHMQQQQAAHMGLGVPVAYRDGAAAGAGGSGRGAFLHLAMPAPADSSQQLWMAQQQGMSGMVAQQGADTAMFAAALTAVAAGGGGPLDQTQLRPELVAQAALQAVPLMAMQGAVPDVQAGALAPGAAAAVAAAAAATGTYPGYNPVPQQQQQQMVRPAAEALMRLAAQQQQASVVRGVTAAQHGWVPGLAAVPAGYAGSAGHGPAQQQPMYAVAGVHGQAAGPQPMWAPQGVQVYGSMPMAAISSPPTGYAAAWPVQAMQQLQPGVLAHQVLQGVHVHSGAVMPGMQGAHTHGMVEEPTSGEVLANVHRSSEHAGFLER